MSNTKNVKILLATGIFPPDIGGPATFAKFFLEESGRYGIRPDLLTFTDEKEGVHKIDTALISRKNNIFLRYGRVFLAAWRLSKGKDLIYSLDVSSVGLPCLLVKILKPKIKLVFRVGGDRQWEQAVEDGRCHATLEDYYQQRVFIFKEKLSYFLMKQAFRLADGIVFNAQIIADVFARNYDIKASKIYVIRNFQDADIEAVGVVLKKQKIRLFFGGRLVAFKNILGFLEIFKDIDFSEFDKEVIFQINGDGPERQKIADYIERNNLNRRVEFHSKVPRAEMLRLIGESDVFILPSLTEVNANTVSEVLLLGQPILLTKFSESCYIGEKNANIFYVNPFDVGDVAAQLKKAIKYSQTDSSSRSRSASEASWNKEQVMTAHLEIFNNL